MVNYFFGLNEGWMDDWMAINDGLMLTSLYGSPDMDTYNCFNRLKRMLTFLMLVFLGIFRAFNSFLYFCDMISDMCTVYMYTDMYTVHLSICTHPQVRFSSAFVKCTETIGR